MSASQPFALLLRRHRERAGLTQEELAEGAGLTAKAVSALERGERRRPYPATVRALADALALGEADRGVFLAAARGAAPAIAEEPAAGTVPRPPTALIGRDGELSVVLDQLRTPEVRLLTLLGPGGVGKTRLAVEAALALRESDRFPDGVTFVDLSSAREPEHVVGLIARTLRAPSGPASPGAAAPGGRAGPADGSSALEGLLARRQLLLVLDNLEQVVAAAPEIGRLLVAAPGLVVLATSREPLRLRWERTLPVAPLPLPDPRHLPSPERLALVPAVSLFLERVRDAAPGFALTTENASAVAELCVRLDGLPLALELVAARAAQLGPAATLDRLARRLPIASPARADAPARQQSLRAALEWSLELLDERGRRLFRRLAVFAGGWSAEAAEAVAGDEDDDTFGALLSLADRSLVVVDPSSELDAVRFRMLETAREAAAELLAAAGEEADARRRHAAFFATFAEAAGAAFHGAEQAAAAREIEREDDNLRQALDWVVATGSPDALEIGLRLTGALGWFWFLHGYPPEARDWFAMLLRPGQPEDPRLDRLRARALNAAGFQATDQADYDRAATAHAQALQVWRRLDDVDGLVASLHGVGDTALWVGDSDRARATYEEGLAVARERGTQEQVALFEFHLAQLAWLTDALDTAERYGEQALATARAAGSTTWPPYALFVLASVAHERRDVTGAGARYREAIRLAWEHRDRLGIRMALPGLAGLATLEGDPVRALRLSGAASALEENAGIWAFPPIRERHERWLGEARARVDRDTADRAWRDGRGLSIDEMIRDALAPAAAAATDALLSPREHEVLALLAQGRSNREIGAALFVTEHTAKYHVTSLFNKLGVSSRAEAVARGIALGLVEPPVG